MIVEYATLDLGDRQAPVEIRVNRRAKRLILKVDTIRARVIVTSPSKAAIPEAISFATSRAAWLREQLAASVGARPFVPGAEFPLEGAPHIVINEGGPRSRIRTDANADGRPALFVGGDPAHTNRRVADWLKKRARRTLTEQTDDFCAQLSVKRGPISVRDTKSRWGSCASDGALSFSWRLILAPPWVLTYVAAHECAHLIHLDHSPAYWRTLATINGDASAARAWFREHGETLYGYGISQEKAAA